MDNKRKAESEHLKNTEQEVPWMRPEGNKRKTVEQEEESLLNKNVYLKTLEMAEAKKESEETQEILKLAEVEVSEEDVDWRMERRSTNRRKRRTCCCAW